MNTHKASLLHCRFLKQYHATSLFMVYLLVQILLLTPGGWVKASESYSTVLIKTLGGYGSGFNVKIANDEAFILTANHVVGNDQDEVFVLAPLFRLGSVAAQAIDRGELPTEMVDRLTDLNLPIPNVPDKVAVDEFSFSKDSVITYWTKAADSYVQVYHARRGEITHRDRDKDIVIIKIPRSSSIPLATLYMTEGEVKRGDDIVSYGYNEDGTMASAEGSVTELELNGFAFLALGVRKGYSGGAVLDQRGYVLGINKYRKDTGKVGEISVIAGFKQLVDSWIGLPRMSVSSEIDSPKGARDGVVSEDQIFFIETKVSLSDKGQVLAPDVPLQVQAPEGFTSTSSIDTISLLSPSIKWQMQAPKSKVYSDTISIITGSETETIAMHVPIQTEKALTLTVVDLGAPEEATYYLGQSINVRGIVIPSGQECMVEVGTLQITYENYLLDLSKGLNKVTVHPNQEVQWSLRTKASAGKDKIQLRLNTDLVDRNGHPVVVIQSTPRRIRVLAEPKAWAIYSGFSANGQDDYGLLNDKYGVEIESGLLFRLANIAQRGIPFVFSISGGVGLDDFETLENYSGTGSDLKVLDWHTFAMGRFGIGYGQFRIHAGGGMMWFNRSYEGTFIYDMETGAPILPERPHQEKSPFFEVGLQLGTSGFVSIYTGYRKFQESIEDSFLFQLRLRGISR